MTITLQDLVNDVRQAANLVASDPSPENYRRLKAANLALKRECMGRNGDEAHQAFEAVTVAVREGRTAEATQAAQRFASAISADFPDATAAAVPSATPEASRASPIRPTKPAANSIPSTPEVTDATHK